MIINEISEKLFNVLQLYHLFFFKIFFSNEPSLLYHQIKSLFCVSRIRKKNLTFHFLKSIIKMRMCCISMLYNIFLRDYCTTFFVVNFVIFFYWIFYARFLYWIF
ncbi:hypothetical protein HanXRQr2_Chr03g0096691 [Helianthus annuus]|uniref:Transmembrane protein n=1 Tax=Helianthus annuus TaxID=4232 RepID=A0A9K3JE64_HELAN|nr:hypothetical protein HanXRQr2_Chr03g0096691 [Helianthus annuus]KAJ0942544.1 hypothetical protein HanPSC8_Chr03g0093231 [Helianthus annuus]